MNKVFKMLSLLALLSISSLSLALEWNFTNVTDKTLVIQVKLERIADNFFNIVGPGQKTSFEWSSWGNRGKSCFEQIFITEYNEQQAANFPGTNSPKLPRVAGTNSLDAKKITEAIDARGPWFNSLDKISGKSLVNNFLSLKSDRRNAFKSKINQVKEKLLTGTSTQEALKIAGINIHDEIKQSSNTQLGKATTTIPSPSTASKLSQEELSQIRAENYIKCNSRDFIIFDVNGKLTLIVE